MDGLTRLSDWPARLAAFELQVGRRPFEWGAWDCAIATAAMLEAITGTPIVDPLLASGYKDADTAQAALVAAGYLDLIAYLDVWADQFGLEPVAAFYAQRGDLAAAVMTRGPMLGWIASNGRDLALVDVDGLALIPIADDGRRPVRAWRLP